MTHPLSVLSLLLTLLSPSPDLEKYFRVAGVAGSFVLYDRSQAQYFRINPERCRQRFLPASTFKIFNALVGLETGVIRDENFVIPWDGVERRISSWNEDQDLKTAIQRSTVPYFQEVARRVGEEKMKYFLEREPYGNADISGGIDRFWLDGGLRISPEEQVEFLRKLYDDGLSFSKRSQRIVKKIILLKETSSYKLRGKTGWAILPDGKQIGWMVGYVERGNDAYFFATNIESDDPGFNMRPTRKEITFGILRDLHVLPE